MRMEFILKIMCDTYFYFWWMNICMHKIVIYTIKMFNYSNWKRMFKKSPHRFDWKNEMRKNKSLRISVTSGIFLIIKWHLSEYWMRRHESHHSTNTLTYGWHIITKTFDWIATRQNKTDKNELIINELTAPSSYKVRNHWL